MNKFNFKGDVFEVGRQKGEVYKKNGMSFPDKSLLKKEKEVYKKQLAIYKKYYPEHLDELRGIASVFGVDENMVFFDFIVSQSNFDAHNKKSCAIFGFKKGKDLFVGRNYDWDPSCAKFSSQFKVTHSNKKLNNFVGITDMGLPSSKKIKKSWSIFYPEDAINEKGLYIGLTALKSDHRNFGLSSGDFIRMCAEKCSSVEDVIEMVKTVPIGVPKAFFVADRFGSFISINHTSQKFEIIYPEKDYLIQTNHYIGKKLKEYDRTPVLRPATTTFLRYYEVLRGIELMRDNFSMSSIKKIMLKKGSYVLQKDKAHTIWHLSMSMKDREYLLFSDIFDEKVKKTKIII